MVVRSIVAVRPDLRIWHDPTQRVRVAFLRMHDLTVELVEPVSEDSPVRRSLAQGTKLLHTCFEVGSIDAAVQAGRDAGFRLIRPPTPAVAFDGRRIAWVFSPEFGLVELLERVVPSAPPPPAD
jgi:methylmalonyl-CoA/ethylmalonyl-CoA epimerase